jgi:hypothetical protein
MNRPDLGNPEVFWREKSRHRAEIPADLVPALAALARANGIDTQTDKWESKTVETILRLIIFGGLTPQAIAAQAIGSTSRPTPPSPPPAAPIAVLSLS